MPLLHEFELPREVAALWQQRGAALPPLQLQEGANRGAKATLDALTNDVVLLRRKDIADREMVAAVRGLIYLWNGWPDECTACAKTAPESERHYLTGLAARQLGDTETAKHEFQQFDDHAITAKLTADSLVLIGTTVDTALMRFKSLLEMVETWEHFAFIDLYEQCRRCVLPASVERVVRGMQCREIELLMVHCLETALGDRLPRVATAGSDAAARREQHRRKMSAEKQRRDRPTSNGRNAAAATITKPVEIKVKCPKCAATLQVLADQRGKKTACSKCKAAFLVPDGSLTNGVRHAAAAQPTIGVRCPKCQTLAQLNPAARGNAHTCAHCAAKFLIPR